MGGDSPVLLFPTLHDCARQQEVRVRPCLGSHVDDAGRTDEAVHRDVMSGVVGVIPTCHPMDRSVEVGAGVLAARDVVPVPGWPALVVAGDLLERERL